MKRTCICISAIFFSFTAFAQTAVQKPMLPLINEIATLPQSGTQAASRCTDADGNCDGNLVVGPMVKQIASIQLSMTAGSGMPDSSMATKLSEMTPEQQQAWAMQYAAKQQAGTAQAHVPTQEELAVTKSQQDLQEGAVALQDSILLPWSRIDHAYDMQLQAIGQKRNDALDKCPVDPKVNLPTAACFNSVQEEYQTAVGELMKSYLASANLYRDNVKNMITARYATADNQLAAANYLATSPAGFQQSGAVLQTDMLMAIGAMNDVVGKVWEKCCAFQHDIDASKKLESDN